MTPEQLLLVEESLVAVKPRLDDVAADFYRRLFAREPDLIRLFVTDPVQQRAKFVEQLYAIMSSIRRLDVFLGQAAELGSRHDGYGASAAHYHAAGAALLGALGAELGPAWTPELERAWALAYNITAEAMMASSTGSARRTTHGATGRV